MFVVKRYVFKVQRLIIFSTLARLGLFHHYNRKRWNTFRTACWLFENPLLPKLITIICRNYLLSSTYVHHTTLCLLMFISFAIVSAQEYFISMSWGKPISRQKTQKRAEKISFIIGLGLIIYGQYEASLLPYDPSYTSLWLFSINLLAVTSVWSWIFLERC